MSGRIIENPSIPSLAWMVLVLAGLFLFTLDVTLCRSDSIMHRACNLFSSIYCSISRSFSVASLSLSRSPRLQFQADILRDLPFPFSIRQKRFVSNKKEKQAKLCFSEKLDL